MLTDKFQEFFEENFDVDTFLALNRKSFTLESLKKDLENYSTTIQNSLVELINRYMYRDTETQTHTQTHTHKHTHTHTHTQTHIFSKI